MRLQPLGLSLLLAVGAVPAVMATACGQTQRPDGGEGLLTEGAVAPVLEKTAHDGTVVKIGAGMAGPTVVYFYPKDETPGCTKEACAFRDAWARYADAGVQIVGVSNDSDESHRAFAEKHELPFPLIADEDGSWARAFGVPTTFGMASRVSFLVGRDGTIAGVYTDVSPSVHANTVLSDAAGR